MNEHFEYKFVFLREYYTDCYSTTVLYRYSVPNGLYTAGVARGHTDSTL